MKFLKNELLRKNEVEFQESIVFDTQLFSTSSLLNGLKNIEVNGKGYYRPDEAKFYVSATIKGIMVVPCALSNVDVDYPFKTELEEVYYLSKQKIEDDIIQVKGDQVDMMPQIFQAIMLEVPLKVISPEAKYQNGKNWEIIREEEYSNEEKTIDPRLEKLKEYKPIED